MTLNEVERDLRRLLLDQRLEERAAFFGRARAGDARAVRRQQLYRRLVQNNLGGAIARACPHARRLAGEAVFDDVVARFLAAAPPTTRLLREVPAAFTAWLQTQDPSTLPAPSFAALCHFEALEIEVTLAVAGLPRRAPEVRDALDEQRPLILDGSARLGIYAYAVDEVTAATTTWPTASPLPLALLCVQRAEQLAVTRLSLAVAKVLLLSSDGRPLGAALDAVVDEGRVAFGADVVDRRRLRADLVDLQRRGVLTSGA